MSKQSQYLAVAALVLAALNYFYLKLSSEKPMEMSSVSIVDGDNINNETDEESPILIDEQAQTLVEPERQPLLGWDNLLQNGSFENSLSPWSHEASSTWSEADGINQSGALMINAPQKSSSSSIIYSKAVEQCVEIAQNYLYRLSARFKYPVNLPDRASVNRVHLYWYGSPNCTGGGQYGTFLEPSLEAGVWQSMDQRQLVPALGARSAKIRIEQRQDGNNDSKALWDDLVFAKGEQRASNTQTSQGAEPDIQIKGLGENHIKNASFDNNLDHWWPKAAKNLRWHALDDPEHGGVMAASLNNNNSSSMGTGSFRQCINISPQQRYQLGAMVKASPTSTQGGGGRLRATWYQHKNCKGAYRSASNHADIDASELSWQQLHIDNLRPQEGAQSVSIGIVHTIQGKGTHTLLWDNFYFRAY